MTGTAGFIGYHLARHLLDEGFDVVGYDGMTDYYDPLLKRRRHQNLLQNARFRAVEAMLEDRETFDGAVRSEEHTSELQSLMRISYAVFCLKKKKNKINKQIETTENDIAR